MQKGKERGSRIYYILQKKIFETERGGQQSEVEGESSEESKRKEKKNGIAEKKRV